MSTTKRHQGPYLEGLNSCCDVQPHPPANVALMILLQSRGRNIVIIVVKLSRAKTQIVSQSILMQTTTTPQYLGAPNETNQSKAVKRHLFSTVW